MERPGIIKFAQADMLCCPRCGEALSLSGVSLRCGNGHCFDVSAKGYANLLPGHKPLKGYDQAFFQARRRIMDAGYYRHILEAVTGHAEGLTADMGCGEGSYALAVCRSGHPVIGLDAAPEAVREASKGGNPVLWLVADLAHPPLRAASVDTVLNIFTPANYTAFRRVLKPGGRLIKAVPGPAHLQELRHALGDRLRSSEEYDSERVASYFARHFRLTESVRLKQTLPIGGQMLQDFLRMTPLTFSLDAAALASVCIDQITIDAQLLTGLLP